MKFLSIVLIAIAMAFNSWAGTGNQIEFVEADLDNGLHVILHEDKSTPIVIVSIMYHVGSKNENPERTGFAHFFEHLLFEGSKNIERGQFDKLITNAWRSEIMPIQVMIELIIMSYYLPISWNWVCIWNQKG